MTDFLEMPSAAYHGMTDHVSKSMLDMIHKSPAHLLAYLDGQNRQETAAMAFGTAFHAAVLEPLRIVRAPKFDKRTKAGKEDCAEFYAGLDANDVAVDPDTYEVVSRMSESVMNHPFAFHIFENGKAEKSVFRELVGVKCKCRPDWVSDLGFIADLKSSDDASPDGFSRSIAKWRYHVQDAFYSDLCGIPDFCFVVVEKSPPYLCAVYVIDCDDTQQGRDEYLRDLETYKACMESGEWSGYSKEVEVIKLPKWARAYQ